MLPILKAACVIKKCEYLPSAEYPAVIITTPATNLPRPSVTPEAVRNSVSMFSLITGARAGISFRNSGSVAERQRARGPLCTPAAFETIKAEKRAAHIKLVADGNVDLRYKPGSFKGTRSRGLSIIHFTSLRVISWMIQKPERWRPFERSHLSLMEVVFEPQRTQRISQRDAK